VEVAVIVLGATAAAIAALGVRRRDRRGAVVPIAVFGIVVAPIPALVVLGALGLGAFSRERWAHRLRRDAGQSDLPLLVDLVALGVGAGLSFRAAVIEAADVVHPSLREDVLRSLRRGGEEGKPVARLFAIARRAAESGASIAVEAAAHAEELRAQRREMALARLRRLPVRLLFPLALLILPGFLLMTLGPTLSAGLARLGI
jgi:pilus assembly protein TadC